MKRNTFYLLVLLLSIGLFSSAKQGNTGCDRVTVLQKPVLEKKSEESKHERAIGSGLGFSPLNFFMAEF